jgi:hypothetical protein
MAIWWLHVYIHRYLTVINTSTYYIHRYIIADWHIPRLGCLINTLHFTWKYWIIIEIESNLRDAILENPVLLQIVRNSYATEKDWGFEDGETHALWCNIRTHHSDSIPNSEMAWHPLPDLPINCLSVPVGRWSTLTCTHWPELQMATYTINWPPG